MTVRRLRSWHIEELAMDTSTRPVWTTAEPGWPTRSEHIERATLGVPVDWQPVAPLPPAGGVTEPDRLQPVEVHVERMFRHRREQLARPALSAERDQRLLEGGTAGQGLPGVIG